jgi:hypothetical protein
VVVVEEDARAFFPDQQEVPPAQAQSFQPFPAC